MVTSTLTQRWILTEEVQSCCEEKKSQTNIYEYFKNELDLGIIYEKRNSKIYEDLYELKPKYSSCGCKGSNPKWQYLNDPEALADFFRDLGIATGSIPEYEGEPTFPQRKKK
jgi:hypothetical protein